LHLSRLLHLDLNIPNHSHHHHHFLHQIHQLQFLSQNDLFLTALFCQPTLQFQDNLLHHFEPLTTY